MQCLRLPQIWLLVKFGTIFNNICLVRSSHQRCSMKKGILKNFSKFTGKHLCHSLIFNKVAGLMSANLLKIRPATLLNKRLQHRCFPVNFVKFLKSTLSTVYVWTTASVLQKTYRRLLVKILGETSVMESFVRKASKPSGTSEDLS